MKVISVELLLLLIINILVHVSGHGKLVLPTPRAGIGLSGGSVIKLTPFSNYTNDESTCGRAPNNDPGPGSITATYQAGSSITIVWRTTIFHTSAPGVRVAIQYSSTDSFNNNVLADNIDIGQQTNYAQGIDGCHNLTVTLPQSKTSDNAVIQWIWATQADGGYYTGCADVKIQSGAVTTTNDNSIYSSECTDGSSVTPFTTAASTSSSPSSTTDTSNGSCLLVSSILLFVALALSF